MSYSAEFMIVSETIGFLMSIRAQFHIHIFFSGLILRVWCSIACLKAKPVDSAAIIPPLGLT